MRRTPWTAAAMPVIAAVVIGGALAATHHTAIPPLTPSALPSATANPAALQGTAGAAGCERSLQLPFTGVAVNPPIGSSLTAFEKTTRAQVRVAEFYNSFSKPFDIWEVRQAIAAGKVPLIQLNPRTVSLAAIAAGRYDSRIGAYADAVRSLRCQVILSFGHEMNGWWYPWGLPRTTPAQFKAAWRRIHDIFAARRATNVIWSWDPSHQLQQFRPGKVAWPASRWYPGDRYVDWVGIDGYLNPGQNFNEIYADQLRSIRSVTSKPIYIAEGAVAQAAGEVRQIGDLFAGIRKWHLIGLIWFELDRKQVYSLANRPAAAAAYHQAVARLPR